MNAARTTTFDQDDLWSIQETTILRLLHEEALADLAAVAQRQACARDELIWGIGEAHSPAYILAAGSLRLYHLAPEGQELTHGHADPALWVDAGGGLRHAGWLYAEHLRVGDQLRTAAGAHVLVVGLRYNVGQADVYTLTVAHDHTFFVGSARVLVHNAMCVPQKALDTLDYIENHGGNPPSGFEGGRTFSNREGRLPAGGAYREYDVDTRPASRSGTTRNAERLVVDTNTGKAWYTGDHYNTFTEIK
jgi:guanyl-specific ribonuclease Sa